MDPKKEMYRKRGAILAGNLTRRQFDAYYCDSREEALQKRWSWCRTALLLAGAEPCQPNRLG